MLKWIGPQQQLPNKNWGKLRPEFPNLLKGKSNGVFWNWPWNGQRVLHESTRNLQVWCLLCEPQVLSGYVHWHPNEPKLRVWVTFLNITVQSHFSTPTPLQPPQRKVHNFWNKLLDINQCIWMLVKPYPSHTDRTELYWPSNRENAFELGTRTQHV